MQIKTKERIQPQDNLIQEVYNKPTDERLKKFTVGKLISFYDRENLILGVVGGFSMSDVELVWVRDLDVEQHSRHRADEVKFVAEAKLLKAKKSPKKEVKKSTKKSPKKKNAKTTK
jgi:hypothetical protein